MVNSSLKAIFSVVLLALHIIAAALAAQLYDDAFTAPLDADNNVGLIGGQVFLMSGWALIGFCGGAGLALVLLLKGTQDEAILNLAAVALASGLVELGTGAKASKGEQDGVGKNIKALEAFTILSGGASALIGALFVLAGDKSSQ